MNSYTVCIEDERHWNLSLQETADSPVFSLQVRAGRQVDTGRICLEIDAAQVRSLADIDQVLQVLNEARHWLHPRPPEPPTLPADPYPTIVMPQGKGVLSHIDTGPHFLGPIPEPDDEPEPPLPPPPAPPALPSGQPATGRPPSLLSSPERSVSSVWDRPVPTEHKPAIRPDGDGSTTPAPQTRWFRRLINWLNAPTHSQGPSPHPRRPSSETYVGSAPVVRKNLESFLEGIASTSTDWAR